MTPHDIGEALRECLLAEHEDHDGEISVVNLTNVLHDIAQALDRIADRMPT